MIDTKKIIVVIPALNEEQNIESVITNIPDWVDEIIVVNDGSTDKTEEISLRCGAIVKNHLKNSGVGSALKTGIAAALELNADILVNIDADGQFNPNDIIKLVEPILESRAEFVTASRFKDPKFYPKMTKVKFYGNRVMSYFISKIINQKFYDVSCGFRAYSKNALLQLNLFGNFTYTQESFIDLAFKNISMIEVPLKVRGVREFGNSRIASNLFKYGFNTLKIIIRTYRDYKPFQLLALFAVINFLLFLGFGSFFVFHYVNTGSFSPHKWAGFVSGYFFILSLILFFSGFILDMFARMRTNQEKILYFLKKNRK